MKSVVSGVIVKWTGAETWFGSGYDLDPDQTYICLLIEKYPGDFRWRCGGCSKGEVRPRTGESCSYCGCIVTQIIRDEDPQAQKRRRENEWRRSQNVAEWREKEARVNQEMDILLARSRAQDQGRLEALEWVTKSAGKWPVQDETIAPPQKQSLKPLPSPGKRKIEL